MTRLMETARPPAVEMEAPLSVADVASLVLITVTFLFMVAWSVTVMKRYLYPRSSSSSRCE